MASALDFTNSLRTYLQGELADIKGWKWRINKKNLQLNIIQFSLNKSAVDVYSSFLTSTQPEHQEDLLQRINKLATKTDFVKRVLEQLSTDNPGPDPRALHLAERVQQLQNQSDQATTLVKIDSYNTKLGCLLDHGPNQATFNCLRHTLEQLLNLKSQLLGEETQICDDNDGEAFLKQHIPHIFHLQKAINCLSLCTEEGFLYAVGEIAELDKLQFSSPINSEQVPSGLNRVYFHLYTIQNKENPNKINRSDADWGMHDFQDINCSTPDEKLRAEQKLRAAQRVQVEILTSSLNKFLEIVKDAREIRPEIYSGIGAILRILEKLELHANDLPRDQKNLVHYLFENLYNIYCVAREKNPTMMEPQHPFFEGDFGRNAFVGDAQNSVPVEYKIQALQKLLASLKDAWKI